MIDTSHIAVMSTLHELLDTTSPQVAQALAEHNAEVRYHAVRDTAKLMYNGSDDPCQEFYDNGFALWLEMHALRALVNTPGLSAQFVKDVALR